MSKRIVFIILACSLAVLVLAACGQPNSAVSENTLPADGLTSVSDTPVEMTAPNTTAREISITVTAPGGWAKKDDDSALIQYENDDGSCFINILKPWIPADATNAMDLAKYQQQQVKDTFQEAQAQDPVETKLDGIDAARVDVDIPISDELSQKQIYIYFFVDGAAYQLMGVYTTDNKQGAADIESIIQSLKIE